MPRSRRVVLVLHQDRDVHAAVAAAAPEGTLVSTTTDWDALAAAIRETPPSTVSIVDPYHGGAAPGPAQPLHGLLARLPSASVVAAMAVTAERACDVAELDEWGIAGIISTGHDDTPTGIRQRIREASSRRIKRLLTAVLPPEISPNAYALLLAAADTTSDGGTVSDYALTLGVSSSTLLRWAEEARLPTPRTLLQWVRVLHAAQLIDEPERTLEEVARACGYASLAELRRVTLRHLDATPAQLRTAGTAFRNAAARFVAALHDPAA
jgi:AraC-like DNA-binding protein